MKRIWLVPLSGALVTVTMALAIDDASAAYRSGAYGGRVHARGVYNRPGLNRAGVYRGGLYGTRYGGYRPGLRAAAAGVALGAAAASTASYYGDDAYYGGGTTYSGYRYYNRFGDGAYANRYRDTAYANRFADRTYYNAVDRTYAGGSFDGGVYRPAGVGYGTAARNYSSNYPTRAIVKSSYVPVFSYYGPLCNPRVDGGCQ